MTIANIPPQTVPSADQLCVQFCTQTELPLNCVDGAEGACLEKLRSTNCGNAVSQAVAKNNLSIYYALGRGKISCYDSF